MARYDILQFAHALRLREMLIDTDTPLLFVMNDDRGLLQAFASVFVQGIRVRQINLAIVSLDKIMTNDAPIGLLLRGRTRFPQQRDLS